MLKILFLWLFAIPVKGESLITTIKNCHDGDTCTTMKGERIRLACIDTPELRGKNADPTRAIAARNYLNGLVTGKEVVLHRITKDRYQRTVAELYIEGINIQEYLVEQGVAKVDKRYVSQCEWTKSQ
tara:strand:- start:720 stop:1100 length:381 start_codon:yes stop_codon:yes gene_type:complete